MLSVFLIFVIWLDRPGQLKLSHAKPTRRKTSKNDKEHGNDCNKEAHMFLMFHDACLFVSTCFVRCFLVFLIVLMWLDRPGQLQSSALQARLDGKPKPPRSDFRVRRHTLQWQNQEGQGGTTYLVKRSLHSTLSWSPITAGSAQF